MSIRFHRLLAVAFLLTVSQNSARADDLDSRVKYHQMKTRWAIEEGKRKMEAGHARMMQEREQHSRNSGAMGATSSFGSTTTMRSTASGSQSHASPTSVKASNGMAWYTNSQHKFRALFKESPKMSNAPGPLGTICNTFAYSERDGATMIGVTSLPATPKDQASVNRTLNGACDGAVKNTGSVEKARYSCSLQGYPGREYTADVPGKGKVKSRIYLVGNMLYQIIVCGIPSFVDSQSSQMFLKSFAIL